MKVETQQNIMKMSRHRGKNNTGYSRICLVDEVEMRLTGLFIYSLIVGKEVFVPVLKIQDSLIVLYEKKQT